MLLMHLLTEPNMQFFFSISKHLQFPFDKLYKSLRAFTHLFRDGKKYRQSLYLRRAKRAPEKDIKVGKEKITASVERMSGLFSSRFFTMNENKTVFN